MNRKSENNGMSSEQEIRKIYLSITCVVFFVCAANFVFLLCADNFVFLVYVLRSLVSFARQESILSSACNLCCNKLNK